MADSSEREAFEVSRREFLRWTGLAGVAIAAAGSVPFLLAEAPEPASGSPERRRRWTMLIDLRRCDGCKKCEVACRKEHNVPEGQNWLKVFTLTAASGTFFLPRPCMHCENPPCVKVCPVNATFRTEDGLVLIDEDRCIGCRYCMAACPYDVRVFNWSKPNPSEAPELHPPDPTFGHRDHRQGVVEKCMFCAHRLKDGRLPACVEGCPMLAIYFGDANEDFVSNGYERLRLSTVLSSQQTFRYKEELGTEPRVYYLPVRR
jgi:molybdopterin-containing oxidoreductase family iron-sulfur binding subunit